MSVSGEDTPECSDAGGVLEGRMGRQGAVKVSLDLLGGHGALTHGLLHQAGIVALVGLQLRGRVCTNTEILSARFSRAPGTSRLQT